MLPLSPASRKSQSSGGEKKPKQFGQSIGNCCWDHRSSSGFLREREALRSSTANTCFSLVLGSLSSADRRLCGRFNLYMYRLRLIPPSSPFRALADLFAKTLVQIPFPSHKAHALQPSLTPACLHSSISFFPSTSWLSENATCVFFGKQTRPFSASFPFSIYLVDFTWTLSARLEKH